MQAGSVIKSAGGVVVNLYAVYSGSEENKSFAESTPSANLQIWITNPTAQEFFVQGKEYYLRLIPVRPQS